MDITKEDIIFNLNNILLSAYSDKKGTDFYSGLVAENEDLKGCVKDESVKDYENVLSGKSLTVESDIEPTFDLALKYFYQGNYEEASWTVASLLEKDKEDVSLLKVMCLCLLNLKQTELVVKKYVSLLEKYIDTEPDVKDIIQSAYISSPKYYKKSISILEDLIKQYPNDRHGFNYYYKLAYLYERVYQDKYLDKQIAYGKRACELSNFSNEALCFTAKLLNRAGDAETAEKYFIAVMNSNPAPDDIIQYSRFLMTQGRLTEAYDLYRYRFKTDEKVVYPEVLTDATKWDGKADISNSTVIVHYEQGFGDSVMLSRYIPLISKMAKKVILVIQKNLIPLLKDSGFDEYCEILSHEADVNPRFDMQKAMNSVMYSTGSGMSRIPHDYHIPFMDLPYLMKTSPDNMVGAEGYLTIPQGKVEKYRKKYIHNNKKIKVGFSYHGNKQSDDTYRDIHAKEFEKLFRMKGVEFYSFQADEHTKELKTIDKKIKVTDLSKTFDTFEETACAIRCMDLIISTDNVLMNLAGAMGAKTYGLFNVFPESRWYKTTGDDIG